MAIKSNREKFIELCEKQVTKVIKQVRLIGNLSNRTNYKYDEKDIRKIISVMEKEIRDMKARFDTKTDGNRVEFKL